ncbi:MAG: chloride channel protein [Ignavibacteriales bacterium]|nr:chloride channel protein [Ignavibacteriales bacterium]
MIYVILVPALGGLIVGILAMIFEKGKKGEGIPNVILAVATKGGIIKGSVAVLKTIQTAISIGTGGAGGKEGPIVQIGAAIGSGFGQCLNLSSDRLRILVGCGAAAGLSAAFNAPLGGAICTMEIILRTFNSRSLGPIIVSSVLQQLFLEVLLVMNLHFRFLLMHSPAIMSSFYIILGIVAGLVSVYFVKTIFLLTSYSTKLQYQLS